MNDIIKKDILKECAEELVNRGGFIGIAEQELLNEVENAKEDANHPLYDVIKNVKNINPKEAAYLLFNPLLSTKLKSLEMATFWARLTLLDLLIKQAIIYIKTDDKEALSNMPQQIQWSALIRLTSESTQKKSPKQQHEEWRACADEIRDSKNLLNIDVTDSDIARIILHRYSLPQTKLRNIRRVIAYENSK